MIDQRTEAQASLYVLGALPPVEAREFEAAMARNPGLRLLVKELRGTRGAATPTVPLVPPRMNNERSTVSQKVTSSDGSDTSVAWINWVPWALAACFAILCVVLISVGQSLRSEAVHLSQELAERRTEAADLQRRLEEMEGRVQNQVTNYQDRILELQKQVAKRVEELNRQAAAVTNQLRQQQGETQRQLSFYRNRAGDLEREKQMLQDAMVGLVPGGTERLSAARMAVLRPTLDGVAGVVGASVWSPADQRGLLVLENLPPLPTNQSYQLWLMDPKLRSPASGGVLPPSTSGRVRLQFGTQSQVESVERFAITIEPRGGSAAPTGRIVYASN